MTVKELKEAIADLPDTMDVFIGERLTDFTYGLVNSCQVKEINFYESPGDETALARDKVLILQED